MIKFIILLLISTLIVVPGLKTSTTEKYFITLNPMKRLLLIMVILLLISNSNKGQSDSAIQEGNATFYIYRLMNYYGSANKLIVMVNNEPVVKLKNGGYYKFETKPGDYFFTIHMGAPGGIKVYAEPGKSYYISCYLNPGLWSSYPILELKDPISGRALIDGNSLHEQPAEPITIKNYLSRLGLQLSGGIGFKKFPIFVDENGDDVNLSPGGGFGVGVEYSNLVSNNFDISITCLFQSSSLSRSLSNASASYNRFSFAVTPSLVIPGKRKDISRFKIGAGAGLYAAGTMKIDGSKVGDTKYTIKYKNAPGFNGTFAYESNFSRRGSINMGMRYIYIKYDFKEEGSTHVPSDPEYIYLNGSSIDFFVTYSFLF